MSIDVILNVHTLRFVAVANQKGILLDASQVLVVILQAEE